MSVVGTDLHEKQQILEKAYAYAGYIQPVQPQLSNLECMHQHHSTSSRNFKIVKQFLFDKTEFCAKQSSVYSPVPGGAARLSVAPTLDGQAEQPS